MDQAPFDITAALTEWDAVKRQLAPLVQLERKLRDQIFAHAFPTPTEGTNSFPLANAWVLKGKYTLNRKLDVALWEASKPTFAQHGIPVMDIVKYTPELVVKPYRELTEEQRKLFETCLEIKPGAPALEIVLPARATK